MTAYLRPNPQFTFSTDGTQIAPHNGVWQPLKGTQYHPTSAICMSAITSASCAWKSAKEGTQITASLHADLERNLLFNLRAALCRH